MRRVLLSTVLLVLADRAQAGDFTGFYTGINAGFAAGHARDRTASAPAAGFPPAGPGAASDLPRSALDAAAAIRRPDRSRAPAPGN
jgi:hypothetical protein